MTVIEVVQFRGEGGGRSRNDKGGEIRGGGGG